jgi:uncharacterized protein involved in type VI secretion and phage assembly
MSILDELMTPEEERARGSVINGVVVGIVVDNKDPGNLGRVRLNFPWLSDGDVTDWVRVATLMAGSGRGSYFIPEVEDEVLVAFDQGNIDQPYVIGSLWSSDAKPPEKNGDKKNNIRQICSRSGHKITLDDTKNQERMEIVTKGGHSIILDDSSGQEKLEIIDSTGDNSIKIDSAQNSIAIESKVKLSIKAKVIEIEASGTMTIKASSILTIEGKPAKIN